MLRRGRAGDGAAIAAIYAPYVRDTVVTFETEAPDAATMSARIAATLDGGMPWIVAEDEAGRVQGYAYAGRFHPRHAYRFTVEPTVYLGGEARGAGLGSMLYERLIALLTQLGYRQAIALVTLPNPASVALHRRFGFHQSGIYERSGHKFGEWIDVGLFQRALGQGADGDAPQEPFPLSGSAIWQEMA